MKFTYPTIPMTVPPDLIFHQVTKFLNAVHFTLGPGCPNCGRRSNGLAALGEPIMIHLLSGPGRIDLAFPPSGTFKLASSQEEITDPKARNHIIAGGLAMNDWERSMNGNQFSFEELDSLKKAYFDTLSTPPSGDAPGGETANARTLRVLRERHLRLWSLFDQGVEPGVRLSLSSGLW